MGGIMLAIFASLGAAVTTWACTTKRFGRGQGSSDSCNGDRDESEEKNDGDRKAEKSKKKEEQAADDDRLPPRHSNSEAHSVQQSHDERSTADASAARSSAEVQEGDDELRAWRPQLPAHLKTIKRIGSGAYGEVFLCEDDSTKSQVAVKVIREFAKEPLRGKRILREIRLLASLQHANLLSTTDILAVPSPDFDDVYIVTPYMHVDLHRLIHSKVPLVESHSRAFVCQILRGLKYLHSAGVMHRDLKPSNVLVNKDCSLKIADFGLARGKSGEEESEELTDYVVTRWYRAPELILLPAGYFEAVDLWSVGCIMMELLTREPLFPGKDHLDMLRRIASVLGFSAERDLAWVPPKDQKVVLQTLRTQRLPEHPEKPLHNRLPRLDDTAEPAAKMAREACLDLVTKLLDKVPLTRTSAAQALAHPYLSHLQNPAAETEAPELFDWNFDRFEATRRALKDRVYAECARYHPEIVERDAEWIRTRGFNLTSGRSITASLDPNSLGSGQLGPFAK